MKNKAVNLLCGVLAFTCLWGITPGTPTVPRLKQDEFRPSSAIFREFENIVFNVTVEGSPSPTCKGWFRDVGSNKLAYQEDDNKFKCDDITYNSTVPNIRVFRLEIINPTIPVLGKYVIIFENSEGIQLFHFEIKVPPVGLPEKAIISAFVVAGVVVIAIFLIIVVACRKRCCRQDDNRRRLRSQSSSSDRTSRPLSMNPFSTLARRSTRNGPAPPPKPPQVSRHSHEPPSSLTTLDPCGSQPCACGTGSTLHTGYVRMDGSVYTEEEEIADAITSTLQRFMKRPRNTTTTPFESNLMKSRRMSRSVPSLYNSGLPAHNMTLPSRRVHPCPSMPPGYPTVRGGYALPGMSEEEGGCNSVMSRGFYPRQHRPSSDSGWDEMSDFASVSVAADSTAMRRALLPLNEDSRNYKKFWRRSEVIYSAELGSEASSPYQELNASSPHCDDDDTLRHSENKYVCMSEYYQGPMSLPNPPMDSFPELPLPPPPPPLKPIPPPKPCVTKDRPYQNLMNNCLKPYDPAGENDDCEDCEQGFFCR
ncbi:uncharacterized protein [Littorina saxatilis]|uniref:uncharacterized protein n=1 Tax=Littorina saxatilis TaxID=31220 RepID=UPI0038B5A5DA